MFRAGAPAAPRPVWGGPAMMGRVQTPGGKPTALVGGSMKVYVRKQTRQPGTAPAGTVSASSEPGRGEAAAVSYPPTVPPFPQEILDRHNARLLQPATAVLL